MIFFLFPLIVGIAIGAHSRDAAKVIKSPPYITNSLVNLGKMDVSFYFNTKDQDILKKMDLASAPNYMFSRPTPTIDEPCPCSMFRNIKDSNPSAILNKILSSNDFFTFKNPTTSVLCCDSHEEAPPYDEPMYLDLGPKPSVAEPLALPPFPYILDNFFNKDVPLAQAKPKTIEILFFPKKPVDKNQHKNTITLQNKKQKQVTISNKSIEKEVKSNYEDNKLDAVSVKKDLKDEQLTPATVEKSETDENSAKDSNHI